MPFGGNLVVLLFYDNQCVFFQHGLSGLHADGSNLTVGLGLDVVGHLHSLKHYQCVTGLYFLTHLYANLSDGARQWGLLTSSMRHPN